ncbi:MAG: hypothetical protein WCJ70_01205 [bacterium]
MRFTRTYLGICLLTCVIVLIGYQLNPWHEAYFSYHDVTQPARIEQFAKNLRSFQFPTSAPDMNWGVGYPIFTFYAPTAYWITTALHIGGLSISQSINASFLLAMIVAGWGMYTLTLDSFKSKQIAFVSALLYSSSPWVAVEIFVRGNLAEMWFIALLPWAWVVIRRAQIMTFAVVALSLALTSHNVLSPVLFGWTLIYAIFQNEKRTVILKIIGLASLMSAYFWIPFIADIGKTYASEVARLTDYRDHFLCLSQLWTGMWGYGGSAPGCIADGQSFMIGKLQILFGVGGMLLYLRHVYIQKRAQWFELMLMIVLLGSVWLTLPISQWFWQIVSPLQSFQFPWRFILFALFSLSYFAGYLIKICSKSRVLPILTVIIAITLFIQSDRFFNGVFRSRSDAQQFHSTSYIREVAAYKVPEYLPRTVDRTLWLNMGKIKPSESQIAELKRQYTGYKPSLMLYTISRFISIATLLCLLCLTRFTATRKRA